MAYYTVSLFI